MWILKSRRVWKGLEQAGLNFLTLVADSDPSLTHHSPWQKAGTQSSLVYEMIMKLCSLAILLLTAYRDYLSIYSVKLNSLSQHSWLSGI